MLFRLPVAARLALALFCAGAASHALTPSVKRLALRLGAIDRPGGRRIHKRPVPRMGGLAIVLGFFLAALLFCPRETLLALLPGALLIAAMGAADDCLGLRPGVKLLLQLAAAALAVRGGVVIRVFLGQPLPGALAVGLTIFWFVACTNAVNLIDGLDGLACGISALGALTMLLVSLAASAPPAGLILAALTGACLGFLPYNRCPAQIFMGDLGSQFLGYVLAAASVLGALKLHALFSFFVPLLALSVPLADTAFAFFRRILRRKSPFQADKSHIHHRLLALGLTQKQAVALLYAVSSVFGLLAVLLAGTSALGRLLCLLPAALLSLVVCLSAQLADKPDRTS